VPVVLYLCGLCHLHLSTGSPEDKLPRNKNTEKIICLPAARASGERRAKGPLGFPTNAEKRRAEDSDAEGSGRGGRGERESDRGGCTEERRRLPRRGEKSAEVHQEKTREEIEGDCKGNRREKERGEKDRVSLLLGLRLPRSR